MSSGDRRGSMPPVPADIKRLLTVEQQLTVKRLEDFGWRIEYVRRPLFQQVVVMVTSYDGKESGVLEPDGQLNMNPDAKRRESTVESEVKDKASSAK